jgi:ribonucleotide monophosphatase NagD (HAD superfamily)
VLLDLDGTLYEDADLIPGAVRSLARIRAAGIPVRFVTNTTRMPRRLLRDRLRGFGIAAELDDVLSAPAAAAAWLRAAGVRRLALYVADASEEDFGGSPAMPSDPRRSSWATLARPGRSST